MAEERKLLVGRIYSTMSTTWSEQPDESFDDVVARMEGRREEAPPKTQADEIIEVIVVRRARITTTVTVEKDDDDHFCVDCPHEWDGRPS